LELEARAAAVHVEIERFRRFDDGTLEIGAISERLDGTAEDRQALFRRALVVLESREDRGDGTLDIGF